MKFGCVSSALLTILAFSEASLSFTGGFTGQVAAHIKWRAPTTIPRPVAVKRLNSIGGDGGAAAPGGLSLGCGGGAQKKGPANSTAATKGQGQQGQSTSLQDFINAATGAAKNQIGAAGAAAAGKQGKGAGQVAGEGAGKAGGSTGQATAEGATQAGAAKASEASAAEPKAVTESEQFSENAGITLGADGTAQNLGGNLGITRGSDGSQSVGGKSGINISAPTVKPPAAAPAPIDGQPAVG